jgi:tetratricopeptide (TPR) repeat protein
VGIVGIVAILAHATPAFAQVKRIQGKVIDEQGQPVQGATIEAAIVAIGGGADLSIMRTDQTWSTRTNASGNYAVMVPQAGDYLVTATKDGVGLDRAKVTVRRSGLVVANLTLWKVSSTGRTTKVCGTSRSIGGSGHASGAAPGLARLLGWLEAVQLHTPGCGDAPAIDVGRWSPLDLVVLLRDVRQLATFLNRAHDERQESGGRASAQRDQLVFVIYDRRFTLDELQRYFYGGRMLRANDLLQRGAVLHADIGMFVPGDVGRFPLVEDGGSRGWRGGSPHWEVGRQLIDGIAPSASADAGALLWYRAVSAYLFLDGNLAELTGHLNRARQVFTQSSEVLFDSAYLHQELSSPPVQASLQQLRANDVSVRVDSRRAELQRAERFFREALVRAPHDSDGRIRLAHTLGELGRHDEAARELRRAIAASPDRRRLYLAELFLGREEEALGRHDAAKRAYERAADLYPDAQSPRLAASQLARNVGDRASAQSALQSLADENGGERVDPWWEFYEPHKDDTHGLIEDMWKIAVMTGDPDR